jgi:hypothetical protein
VCRPSGRRKEKKKERKKKKKKWREDKRVEVSVKIEREVMMDVSKKNVVMVVLPGPLFHFCCRYFYFFIFHCV